MENKFTKGDNIKKNFIFQIAYQAIMLLIPLFLSPFVTRRLGDSALGVYTYVNSIAYYFVIAANLGILTHGQRVISKHKSDEIKLRKTFWSLFCLHIVISIVSIICYCLFNIFFVKENSKIFWAFSIYIFSALIDITWFFYGVERFKGVVIKNLVIKISCFILIILFVKTPDDLLLYTVIEMGALLFGNALLLPSVFKNIKFIRFNFGDIKQHLQPLFYLSIVVLAVAFYTIFDKTLLGIMSNKENVAYYEYSNKIINIPKTFISVIGAVIFPRACYMESIGDYDGQKKFSYYGYFAVAIIAIPSIFGLLSVGEMFATIYYGESFAICGKIIKLMCPLILTIGLGDVIRNIFLIPHMKDVQFIIIQCINAVINIILSVLLIPNYGVFGAVIGTISAEFCCLLLVCIVCRKNINLWHIMKPIILFSIPGLVMFFSVLFIDRYLDFSISTLIIEICIGATIYTIISFIIILIFYKDLWQMIKNKFFHKKKVSEGDNI